MFDINHTAAIYMTPHRYFMLCDADKDEMNLHSQSECRMALRQELKAKLTKETLTRCPCNIIILKYGKIEQWGRRDGFGLCHCIGGLGCNVPPDLESECNPSGMSSSDRIRVINGSGAIDYMSNYVF